MGRRKDQTARRTELLNAAVSVINDRGPAGVQMKDVARAANMATGSIYYYYDDVDDLMRQVHALAVDRYLTTREQAVTRTDDPVEQMVAMIALGLPRPADVPLSLALYQVEVAKARNPEHAALITELCGAQVRLFHRILEAGVGSGDFDPTLPTEVIAEHLIALEDGYGLALCSGKKGYTYTRCHALVLEAAAQWTQCEKLLGRAAVRAARGRPASR